MKDDGLYLVPIRDCIEPKIVAILNELGDPA